VPEKRLVPGWCHTMSSANMAATVAKSFAATETLRDLERDGLVERHVYTEMPPRVEYELTALGRTLHAPLLALSHWAEQHIAEVLAAREAYDAHR
jgi:DNA-binding HxlR family transcriptional regulator